MPISRTVFVSGATGYMGRPLVAELLRAGHHVRALVRPGSEHKVPQGLPLRAGRCAGCGFLRATGAPRIGLCTHDRRAASQSVQSRGVWPGRSGRAARFCSGGEECCGEPFRIHPAPVMKAYIDVRIECEEILSSSGLNATILRPWYVLGPRHRWPYLLLPLYWLAQNIPSTREGAQRLGLVRLDQMVRALVRALEEPACGVRVLEVPEIRAAGRLVDAAPRAA